MAAVEESSLVVPGCGRQHDSRKETMPAFSFGTAAREAGWVGPARPKVFISHKHEKHKGIMASPGPAYSVPSTVGEGPKFGFGTDEQRKHPKAKYPDSSVDLMCATVDTQPVKYHGTKSVHFGTESKGNSKNAEIIRTHPSALLGMESPGALAYNPDGSKIEEEAPQYSFGPKRAPLGEKQTPRFKAPAIATPRQIGPGSHNQPAGLGEQCHSARKTAPSYSFGGEARDRSSSVHRDVLDAAPTFSSLGKSVISNIKSTPRCGFGKATRDQVAKTHLASTDADRGPAAFLPKQNFHLDLPPAGKLLPKPGM